MIEVALYIREDCHLCEEVTTWLEGLQNKIPHVLHILNVDQDAQLQKQYGFEVPVIVVGPYTLRAPITELDLLVTLQAASYREQQISDINSEHTSNLPLIRVAWTKSDKITLWLSRHYLAAFNLFIFLYISLPFLAPVLMKIGAPTPAGWIYRAYSVVCHELAFRSWFLFGDQVAYPREAAAVEGLISYDDATGLGDNDLWAAREYIGNDQVGYKVALCERDVAIYGGILLFGLVFAASRRRLKPIHWIFWIGLGILPIGLDGLSQLASQAPLNLISYRESTPLLRSVTGFLFGWMTAWFGYPYVEETMRENRRVLELKLQAMLNYSTHKRKDHPMNLASSPEQDT